MKDESCPSTTNHNSQTSKPPCGNSNIQPLQIIAFLHLRSRANPFPEVTDLFCRLPLSTFFYRPEASHLGDLRRLSVRPRFTCFKLSLSIFQGPTKCYSDGQQKCIHSSWVWTASRINSIPRFSGFSVKKKRKLFHVTWQASSTYISVAASHGIDGWVILNPFPFGGSEYKYCYFFFDFIWPSPPSLGPTNFIPNVVLWKPCSTSAQKVLSFVFATTTKICTQCWSKVGYPTPSTQHWRPPTYWDFNYASIAKYRWYA